MSKEKEKSITVSEVEKALLRSRICVCRIGGGRASSACAFCLDQKAVYEQIAVDATLYRFRDRGRGIRADDNVYIARAERTARDAMLDINDAAREELQSWSAKESGYT